MRYKGFEFYASEKPQVESAAGNGKVFACEIYRAEDGDRMVNVLSVFDLVVAKDVGDNFDDFLIPYMMGYIDDHYGELMALAFAVDMDKEQGTNIQASLGELGRVLGNEDEVLYDEPAEGALEAVLGDAQSRAQAPLEAGDDLRWVYVLICTHTTRFGVDSFAFVKPTREEAEAFVEEAQKYCDFNAEERGEYFDYSIEAQVLDVNGLEKALAPKEQELV